MQKITAQEFISFLKTLTHDDWGAQVTDMWTVKDVVAHMVGWEKRDAQIIPLIWSTKQLPQWMTTKEEYDAFNRVNVEQYAHLAPEDLLSEWEKWQSVVQTELETVGYEQLQSRPDLFGWLLEARGESGNHPNDDPKENHYFHHYVQIKDTLLEKKK